MEKRPAAALSTNLQKAVQWIGEVIQEHPEKQRNQVVSDAQLRFDLTPAESEFLNHNFKEIITGTEKGNR
ncbi:MAG: hypothetical protein WGN25_13750 [Candidatus Electrothrix sp. GW3-4]|uniref:hypothetical protein n=1 Tax=Candidatus Electrothrix sp. GW3-4 TaxID=3126740 RepID=UPI0030CB51AD